MHSKWSRALVAAVLGAAGCARTEDYLAVAREQREALREVAGILAKVHDEQDMRAARSILDDRLGRFDAIARKAKALPQPPPPEVLSRLEDDRFFIERALKEVLAEVRRVKELPGGAAFFKQYEDQSSLFSSAPPAAKS